MGAEQEVMRAGLRHAGARAARTERVAGSTLIAVLCAGALAPLVAVPLGAGDLGSAMAGLIGSIGGNVATDLLTGVADRLRGRTEAQSNVDTDAVERALAEAIERALVGGGPAGVAMRQLAAAILREAGAVEAVLAGAASADPGAAEAVAAGLAGLAEQFSEFAAASADLRVAALELQRELAVAAGERRERADSDRQLALLASQLIESLDGASAKQESGSGEAPVWEQCPYPGLRPFDERDAAVFFGRRVMIRSLVHEVAERAHSGGMLLVLGASGAGKSSLLRAGLVPALARDALGRGSVAWPVRVITPTDRPLAELAARLAALSGADSREVEQVLRVAPQRAADLAVEAVARYARDAESAHPVLVLVVDQFEQLFTDVPAGRGQDRALFVQALGALASAAAHADGARRPAAVVLAAIRGDFLDQAALYPAVAQALASGPFMVGPMSRAQLRQAIEGPAAEAGVTVEPTLVKAILDEALGGSGTIGPGVQVLPLVSQALAETWRVRRGRSLTLRAYHRAGGLTDAADRSAQNVYDALDEQGREAARTMFMLLTRVTADGRVSRRVATRAELLAASGLAPSAGNAVIDAFTQRRLLVAEHDGIAICHDVLLDAWRLLREWLEGDAADRALYSDVLADAQAWRSGGHDLYGRRRLAVVDEAAVRWAGDPARYPELPPLAARFLGASRRAARRAAWLRRAALIVLIALTATATGFAIDAQHNARRAESQHLVALSRQLAADSAAAAASDPTLAQELAATAWALTPTAEADQQMTKLLTDDARQGIIRTSATITAVAFSPDGRTLAAGCSDGTVRLWDPATGEPRTTVTHTANAVAVDVSSVAFSPDGHTLAAGALDGTVRLWDPATGRSRTTITDTANSGAISVAFSPDGRSLAVGSSDGTVRLWDPRTGKLRVTITDATNPVAGRVSSVAFSPDGRTLAAGALDGTVRLWDPTTGKLHITITDTTSSANTVTGGVISVAFSSDGRTLAAGALDGTVRLWDPTTGKLHITITDAVGGGAISVAFSSDGRTLAAGLNDGTVRLLDPATGKPRTTVDTYADATITYTGSSVAFSSDGHTLAAGLNDGTVRLLDPTTGKPRTTIDTYASATTAYTGSSVAFSPDGRTLAAAVLDGTVRVWDAATEKLRTTITNPSVTSMAFSPDGRTLAGAVIDGTVRLWDPGTGKLRTTITYTSNSANVITASATSLAFSPDGRILAAGLDDGTVRLWDPATGKQRTTITDTGSINIAGGGVSSVAFSPDGRTLAAGSGDNAVRLWDPATGKLRLTITDTTNAVTGDVRSVAFSPDGHILAAGSSDGSVRLWDPATGKLRLTVTDTTNAVTGDVRSVTFSPDGHILAAGSADNAVRLWDPATGNLHHVLDGTAFFGGGVSSVAFSPDGRTLAASSNDGSVVKWPPTVFADSYPVLCANVGTLPSGLWSTYAAGEPGPPTCAPQ